VSKDFNESVLPPVKWFLGDMVQDTDGVHKLEWNDPKRGTSLKTEEQLIFLEERSRDMLIQRHIAVEPEWTTDVWAKWRDLNINAERGLQKLQQEKQYADVPLSTPFKPRMPEC